MTGSAKLARAITNSISMPNSSGCSIWFTSEIREGDIVGGAVGIGVGSFEIKVGTGVIIGKGVG